VEEEKKKKRRFRETPHALKTLISREKKIGRRQEEIMEKGRGSRMELERAKPDDKKIGQNWRRSLTGGGNYTAYEN